LSEASSETTISNIGFFRNRRPDHRSDLIHLFDNALWPENRLAELSQFRHIQRLEFGHGEDSRQKRIAAGPRMEDRKVPALRIRTAAAELAEGMILIPRDEG